MNIQGTEVMASEKAFQPSRQDTDERAKRLTGRELLIGLLILVNLAFP